MKKTYAVQRALAGMMSVALITGGLGVVTASPALAHQVQCVKEPQVRKGIGAGELTIVEESVVPGGVVTIKGTGFEARPADGGFIGIKINQNDNKWPEDQSAGSGLAFEGGATTLHLPGSQVKDGAFEVKVVLPSDLGDGNHVITFVAGNDGGPGISRPILVKVLHDPAHPCIPAGTVAEPKASAEPNVLPNDGRFGKAGDIVVNTNVTGFTPGETVAAKLGDQVLKPLRDRAVKVKEDGTASASFVVPGAGLRPGQHTITVHTTKENLNTTFTTEPAATVSNNAAAGSTSTLSVAHLPVGAKVTGVGTEGANWLSEAQAATEVDGKVVIEGVKVPANAPFGGQVFFTYVVGDTAPVTAKTNSKVNASTDAVGEDAYSVITRKVPAGLYQSAVNSDKGLLFVTQAVRTSSSTLMKLNADTLETIAENKDLGSDGKDGVMAAYGIGLDNKRELVWITNTRHDTVSVYKQSDLSLVKHFDKGETNHPRDIVIDERTGKAYVTAAGGNTIDIFDLSKEGGKRAGQIDLGDFPTPMSIEYLPEQNLLFTTSRGKPKAVRVDLTTEKATVIDLPADKVAAASGIAYDPATKNLFIASQDSGNTVVINSETGAFVKEIPTGALALNAHYNPRDKRVYITNRGAGTVTVIDPAELKVVANLPAGKFANHISVGANGAVYAVNKAAEKEGDINVDTISRFQLKNLPPADNTGGSSVGNLGNVGKILLGVLGAVGILGVLGAVAAALVKFGLIPAHLVPAPLRGALG
ncbi:hypothetical protein P4N68_06785 [Corynebacterium felinum]|uniref:YVTN family beta-propeller protein n=1 Tax=Corynebacterium felinum TaxID=131318 RepID=A0ABU2B5E6_9CORY|nr:hypothetical protein [Corynebacterium felinum]MDF5820787.1 hypothetical protein [Corynebacterium felinum]MDR7353830.1 YVTN family beta-propeller protein [Corynebacterium felinum]WJY96006.1 hypothetical protein CFELI_12125 [Corynebacterium felinum]